MLVKNLAKHSGFNGQAPQEYAIMQEEYSQCK
jgi:hypothetical protein